MFKSCPNPELQTLKSQQFCSSVECNAMGDVIQCSDENTFLFVLHKHFQYIGRVTTCVVNAHDCQLANKTEPISLVM